MAKWVGLNRLLSAFVSRRTLECLMTRSCIAAGISADLSRTFKSTASAASWTWLAGGAGGFVAGTNANMRLAAHCTTFSLSFGGLLLLSFSNSGLSMQWERECVWTLEREKVLFKTEKAETFETLNALTGNACGFCFLGVWKWEKRGV